MNSIRKMNHLIKIPPLRSVLFIIFLVGLSSYSTGQADLGPDEDFLITISTPYGDMKALLFEDTPMHKENFIALAKAGVYDGVTFHRVIDRFMIQTGDPKTRKKPLTEKQRALIPEMIPAEINPEHSHVYGAIGAARRGNNVNPYKNSSPTQFYIVENHNGAPHLDGEYTVFGQVMSGLPVIDSIASLETGKNDKPIKNIRIEVSVDKVKKKEVEQFYNFQY